MEGRARDERHDGRRGPHAPPVPRHPHRRGDRRRPRRGSARSSATTAPGRTSTADPAICRRRSRPTSRSGSPATPSTPATCAGRGVRPRAAAASSAARVFTRIWLALFGLWSWDDLPALPPEVCSSRRRCRSTSTTSAAGPARPSSRSPSSPRYRPVRPLPFGIDELRTRRAADARPAPLRPGAGRFDALDRVLHRYERRPVRRHPARRALRRARERWIVERQEADGRWGGIQPPWVYSIMALAPARLPARPPGRSQAGLRGLDGFTIDDDGGRAGSRRASRRSGTPRSRSSRSPTPGDPPTTRRSPRAADWLLGEEITVARRLGGPPPRPRTPAAGRSSSRTTTTPTSTTPPRSSWRSAASRPRRRRRRGRGRPRRRAGCVGMQCADGGWGAFDVDNVADVLLRAPVLRLRRGDRPAERGRHRARRRDARRRVGRPRRRVDARRRLAARRSRSTTARGSAAGA